MAAYGKSLVVSSSLSTLLGCCPEELLFNLSQAGVPVLIWLHVACLHSKLLSSVCYESQRPHGSV